MSESPTPPAVRRRDFLKVLGATGAATAALGCSSDRVEKLIPYLVQPDQTTPGVSNYYATTCRECAVACGVLAEVRDGRTFKLEGNPAHPLNRGALCARGQAAVQGLLNPDRYRQPKIRRAGKLVDASWQEALQLFAQRLGAVRASGRGASTLFIAQHESGAFPIFLDGWLTALGLAPALRYEPLAEQGVIAANRQTYGVAWPTLDFSAARLIVSFGADFLETWGAQVPQQLDFANARATLTSAPRLVYIGPRRSLTGLNADEWIACRPGSELTIANALAGRGSIDAAAQAADVPLEALQRLAAELRASRPSVALAGGTGVDGTELALAVNALNGTLGAVGTIIRPDRPITAWDGQAGAASLLAASARMAAGQVPMVMVRGANPVFTLPNSSGFAAAFAKVPFKVSFSSYPDETSEMCDLVLPDNHPLESWGIAQPLPDVMSLQQPGMEPVFDTRATPDVLVEVARGIPDVAARYPQANYREWITSRFPGGAQAFADALVAGVASGSFGAAPAAPATAALTAAAAPLEQTKGDFYLVLYPSPALGAGDGANKPWLQELPDPVAKISWQSWVEINPRTAVRLSVQAGDMLRVTGPAGAVTAPAYIYPGIREDTVAMMLGRGHTAYGRYAAGVGVNPLDAVRPALDVRAGSAALVSTRVSVERTGDFQPLVSTEGSPRQQGRGIAQAVPVGDLRGGRRMAGAAPEVAPVPTGAEPEAGAGEQGAGQREGLGTEGAGAREIPGEAPRGFLPGLRSPVANDAEGDLGNPRSKDMGMYDPNHWSGMARRRWAMTIDLARCTGCSACITACYAENNIPTVGAPYQGRFTSNTTDIPGSNIIRGREMTWIRLERYYEGNDAGGTDFDARFVPMLCQHCGNAPCEPVCPVYATYHSPDGLNVQVYNRCVGTRYCSNNCPYKVRYFNWFGYGEPARPQYAWPEPLNWQLNPDVTVRGKGVMEKCTFCVQRIREAEHRSALEGSALAPDAFTTSCAQACPSRAIVFGDAADPAWAVNRLIGDERSYHVFEELNTYTAVVYLKKVLHPAPLAPAEG